MLPLVSRINVVTPEHPSQPSRAQGSPSSAGGGCRLSSGNGQCVVEMAPRRSQAPVQAARFAGNASTPWPGQRGVDPVIRVGRGVGGGLSRRRCGEDMLRATTAQIRLLLCAAPPRHPYTCPPAQHGCRVEQIVNREVPFFSLGNGRSHRNAATFGHVMMLYRKAPGKPPLIGHMPALGGRPRCSLYPVRGLSTYSLHHFSSEQRLADLSREWSCYSPLLSFAPGAPGLLFPLLCPSQPASPACAPPQGASPFVSDLCLCCLIVAARLSEALPLSPLRRVQS